MENSHDDYEYQKRILHSKVFFVVLFTKKSYRASQQQQQQQQQYQQQQLFDIGVPVVACDGKVLHMQHWERVLFCFCLVGVALLF